MGRGRRAIPKRIVQSHTTKRNSRQHWVFKGHEIFHQNTSFTNIIGTADENLRSQTHRIDAMRLSSHFSVLQGICRIEFSSFQRSSLPHCSELSQWVAVDGVIQCHK